MATIDQLLSFNNPVLSHFAFYGTLVLLKMFAMAFLTGAKRRLKQDFTNPEDNMFKSKKSDEKTAAAAAAAGDPDVERVRRIHMNDLENIPAFLFLGFFYVLSNPNPVVAVWFFRAFALSRFGHTISYQFGLQPHRSICFAIGLLVSFLMAFQILLTARS